MVKRPKRHFGEMDKQTLLEAIRVCRSACIDASAKSRPCDNPVYAAIRGVTEAIDELAGTLSGDRTLFHTKGHSCPPRSSES